MPLFFNRQFLDTASDAIMRWNHLTDWADLLTASGADAAYGASYAANPGDRNESSAHRYCLLDNDPALRQNPVTAADLGNGSQIQNASVMDLRPLTGKYPTDGAFSEFMEVPFHPHSNHFTS